MNSFHCSRVVRRQVTGSWRIMKFWFQAPVPLLWIHFLKQLMRDAYVPCLASMPVLSYLSFYICHIILFIWHQLSTVRLCFHTGCDLCLLYDTFSHFPFCFANCCCHIKTCVYVCVFFLKPFKNARCNLCKCWNVWTFHYESADKNGPQLLRINHSV